MNRKLLLIALTVAAFSSCTTLYKSGQTPDDVYFSPATPAGEERTETTRRSDRYNDYYDDAYSYNQNRVIRMGFTDPRWRYFDYDYSYSPYYYGYNYGYYYNPYYWPYPVYSPIIINPVNPKNTTPRMANLSTYSTPTVRTTGGYIKPGSAVPPRTYNNSNSKPSAFGSAMRQILSPSSGSNSASYNNTNSSNNNSNNSSNNSTRSYTPSTSSSSSSSSGSSSSSSGSVSRPPRNGN